MAPATHRPEGAASFPRRFAAAVVDLLLLAVLAAALHFGGVVMFDAPVGAQRWYVDLFATVSLPSFVYFALCDASANGATLGKRYFGIRMAHVYGARISLARALVRTFVKLLPWEMAHLALCYPEPVFATGALPQPRLLMATYAIGALYLAAALMTLKKQALHDLVVGTWIVRVPQRDAAAS